MAETPLPPAPAPTWTAWYGGLQVLTVFGRPGPIVSMAPPPPGPATLWQHPFLSAASSSPLHEDRVHRLLAASDSLDGFLRRLEAAGYVVRAETPTP